MDIVKTAKKAGIVVKNGELFLEARPFDALQIFEKLVRADEREACAFICDGISDYYETRTDLNQTQKQVGQLAAEVCGVRIRERE